MKKALPGLVPKRFFDINIRAFEGGYQFGLDLLNKDNQKE
jgi:hypothetical protein